MLSRELLPLIDEAAARVYSVVKETPLVRMRPDPAGGVALAACFKEAARHAHEKCGVLICGGNPSPAIAAPLQG